MSQIKYSRDIAALERMDFVVEASYEEKDLKLHLLKSVEQVVARHCPIATTTSSFLIKDLAKAIPRSADRFLGIHFFQPVHLSPLVEFVKTQQTS
mmetsp:Transcript_27869/g.20888  ORF Transcript_27869/g.20888 Transcript_27869/m.20888 type:complete len:95 (+) Transcript_27869:40-324(+)